MVFYYIACSALPVVCAPIRSYNLDIHHIWPSVQVLTYYNLYRDDIARLLEDYNILGKYDFPFWDGRLIHTLLTVRNVHM